jgi:ABC-type multidrug transport system ATPase subunit
MTRRDSGQTAQACRLASVPHKRGNQRLAIARALLRRPALLLLDEPTNHLDDASVRRLLRNLRELRDAPAIVIISHNPYVVREAQHLYVLREGRIVASRDAATASEGQGRIIFDDLAYDWKRVERVVDESSRP